MLTKRAQILFQEETWQKLIRLARQQNTSAAELVRHAVKTTYQDETSKDKPRTGLEEMQSIAKKAKVDLTTEEILDWKHTDHRFK
jgi:hypothetical protein